jgi:hypothetical protein
LKTDKSIHNICLAAIKRSTIKPYDFKWTTFYESNAEFKSDFEFNLTENELIICSTIINKNNYSILTTKQLYTNIDGYLEAENIFTSTIINYGEFKSNDIKGYTFGLVQLENGQEFKYFIETGKASMVMIQGVKTLIRTTKMTATQVEKLAIIWSRENDINF